MIGRSAGWKRAMAGGVAEGGIHNELSRDGLNPPKVGGREFHCQNAAEDVGSGAEPQVLGIQGRRSGQVDLGGCVMALAGVPL